MPPDDPTLLARFAATGDQAAFAALVDRHGPLVLGVCRRAVRNDALADEAFQAVFVVLARAAGKLRLRTSLANWLFGVACKVAKRAGRREGRTKQLERLVADRRAKLGTAVESDRGGPEWDDLLRVLDEELGKLSEQLRGPLVACYLQGKTQDEAAADLGWTVFTLRRRLARARDFLRGRLSRRGVTFAAGLFAGMVFASVGFAAPVPPAVARGAVAVAVAAKTGGAVPAGVLALAHGVVGVPLLAKLAALAAVGLTGGAAVVGFAAFHDHPRPVDPAQALTSRTAAPTPAGSPSTGAPTEWVTLRGRVVWPTGQPIPAPEVEKVTTDRDTCCRDGNVLSNRLLVDAADRGVRNVAVWLRPDSDDRDAAFPRERIAPPLATAKPVEREIDQPRCQFEPRVLLARAGDTLVIKNSAAIRHNAHLLGREFEDNSTIDASRSYELPDPLRASRLPITVKCDIHPWMQGRVRVFDHPYFALTDEHGRFEMPLAPVGRWRIVYWHEDGFHDGAAGALGTPLDVPPRADGLTLPPLELHLPK